MDKDRWLTHFSERCRFHKVAFDLLTPTEQVFAAIWWLEADVNQGGFHAYYFNAAGDSAYFAAGALRAIGAENMARLVAAANAVFPGSAPPRNRMERQRLLLALPTAEESRLADLSRAFFKYPDDLTELLHAYVQEHLQEFLPLD